MERSLNHMRQDSFAFDVRKDDFSCGTDEGDAETDGDDDKAGKNRTPACGFFGFGGLESHISVIRNGNREQKRQDEKNRFATDYSSADLVNLDIKSLG